MDLSREERRSLKKQKRTDRREQQMLQEMEDLQVQKAQKAAVEEMESAERELNKKVKKREKKSNEKKRKLEREKNEENEEDKTDLEDQSEDQAESSGNVKKAKTSKPEKKSDNKSVKKTKNKPENHVQKPKTEGRPWTLSIAIPGSILDNAQSIQLRSYLAGQIGRALAVYNVDEIIIFDEEANQFQENRLSTDGDFQGVGRGSHCCVQLGRVLQYLECPQYLRKYLFKKHKDLEYAGLCNPLDATHHLREEMYHEYREGVIVARPLSKNGGSYADCGLKNDVRLDREVPNGSRVTVKMLDDHTKTGTGKIRGIVVSPEEPRKAKGHYWGYNVRLASSLSDAMTGHPSWEYDLMLGTSERGEIIDKVKLPRNNNHILCVIGGVRGLEYSLEGDLDLKVKDPKDLFDYWLNVCPDQGSRTIRTEEAILIILSSLRPKIFTD